MIFQSFQSGNLKQLDLEFYLKLRLPTTKRMYRFLDKRFYRRSRLDFDLRTLACEHIGLSRSYAPTELKRRLKPALEEMEQLGFLEPLGSGGTVFLRQARLLENHLHSRPSRDRRGAGSRRSATSSNPPSLSRLSKRAGSPRKTAQELVETHPPAESAPRSRSSTGCCEMRTRRVGKNPAGYLVASIRSDYQVPGDYQTQTSGAKSTGVEIPGSSRPIHCRSAT